jgi:hypothetical protein
LVERPLKLAPIFAIPVGPIDVAAPVAGLIEYRFASPPTAYRPVVVDPKSS